MADAPVPIFINCRDRVSDLRRLVAWLERAGHDRITLLDNDSTYPPLLEYLNETPHRVVWFGRNRGSQALWEAGLVPNVPFVYTDPDVVPLDDCPLDAVQHFLELLNRHDVGKVGFGLSLQGVAPFMPSVEWETGPTIRGPEVEPGARRSLIDTTFAVYRPGPFRLDALRTEPPYTARHSSWHVTELSDEDRFYLNRAEGPGTGSSWKSWAPL